MDKKYFPIHTETACRLKWSWSTLYLNTGTTASCHRASESILTNENFFNFHNTERKIIDRQTMLEGKWPGHGCEYCRDTELEGAQSDRQFQLTVPNEYPESLDSNPNQVETYPTTLEVFFNNTCNLACIYCKATFSSRIETEDKKFGYPLVELADGYDSDKGRYKDFVPLFWSWLDRGYDKLLHFNVLGGEPLIQDDLYKLLDYINEHPNPNLTLNIITNLMVKKETIIEFVNKARQILANRHLKRIMILASVECWGSEQEYIRYGFNCKTFEENIEYLLDQKFLDLNLLSTVNALSINSMPELAEKVKKWNTKKDVVWYTHLVLPIDKHILSPNYFDFSIYENAFNQVLDSLKSRTDKHKETILLLEGIVDKLKSTSKNNPEKKKKLLNYLTEIDRRRNLNWKSTFTWLERNMEDVV